MATCLECQADLEAAEVEIGDIISCSECGAEMEVVGVHPLELELVEEEEEEEEEDFEDSDDADEDAF